MADENSTAGESPSDSTERRDWDLPPAAGGNDAAADRERGGALHDAGHEPPPDALHAPGDPREAPADESERRDWDLP